MLREILFRYLFTYLIALRGALGLEWRVDGLGGLLRRRNRNSAAIFLGQPVHLVLLGSVGVDRAGLTASTGDRLLGRSWQ